MFVQREAEHQKLLKAGSSRGAKQSASFANIKALADNISRLMKLIAQGKSEAAKVCRRL